MKVTIKGTSKADIAKKIEQKFKGIVTIKAAKKMVKNIKDTNEIEVKTPKWFRFRNAKGHFVKGAK
jgi:hypothetical protein